MSARTLFERIWESHVVEERAGEPALLYVDLHLVHEVTSPQAFESLRLAGRRVRRPELTIATMGAYAFAWMKFPGKNIFFIVIVGLMVVPIQMTPAWSS